MRRWVSLAVCAGVLVASGCAAGGPGGAALEQRAQPASTAASPESVTGILEQKLQVVTLTSPNGRDYRFTGNTRLTTFTAPADVDDDNVRQLFWPRGPEIGTDQQVCVVWNDPATRIDYPYPQPGIALRITPSGTNGFRAVTITQNVFEGAIWHLWVDTWDTSRSPDPTPVASFDAFPIVGIDTSTMHETWHVCGRARGDAIAVKIWVEGPEPSWSDARHVFRTRLPAGWKHSGHAGGYIGHLRAGQSATFADLVVTSAK